MTKKLLAELVPGLQLYQIYYANNGGLISLLKNNEEQPIKIYPCE